MLQTPGSPRAPRTAARSSVLVLASATLGGCAGALDPKGPAAASRETLFLAALAVAVAVIVLVTWLTVRAARSEHALGERADRFVLLGGLVMPTVVLMAFMGYSFSVLADVPDGDRLRIELVGHQYWWEVRYPDTGLVTANEIHVPTGRPVEFVVTTDDVNHSVWIPELGPKIDMIPGRVNEVVLQADEPGSYLGHCAEFCGLQHAKMKFHVVAEEPDRFEAWLAAEAEPARFSSAAAQQAFTENSCAACHTVRGTDAAGEIGPDLTHFASREFFGAGVVPTTRDNLLEFVPAYQSLKHGALMPDLPQAAGDLELLVDTLLELE
jgi:cytochrome c oxidase subunit 2